MFETVFYQMVFLTIALKIIIIQSEYNLLFIWI